MMSEFKAQISNVKPPYSTGTRKKKEDGQEAPLLFGHHTVSEHSTTFSDTESLVQAAYELNISEINSRKIRKMGVLPGACRKIRTEASGSEALGSNDELALALPTEVKKTDKRCDQASPKTLNEQRRLFINNWFGPADMTLDSLFGTHIGNGNGFVIFKSSPDYNHYAVLITRFDNYSPCGFRDDIRHIKIWRCCNGCQPFLSCLWYALGKMSNHELGSRGLNLA